MQVLTDFVDYGDDLTQWWGGPLRNDARTRRRCKRKTLGRAWMQCKRLLRLLIELLRIAGKSMAHLYRRIDRNAVSCERLRKALAGKLSRVLHGDPEIRWFAAYGNGSEGTQEGLVRLTVQPEVFLRSCDRCNGLVFQIGGILGKLWVPGGSNGIACRRAGGESQVMSIVIHGQCGDRSAVVPHQIILPPTLAVAFPCEESIVGDDSSIERLDAARGHLRSQIIESVERRVRAFSVTVVRISAA